MHRVGVLHNCTQLFGIERLMQAQRTGDAIERSTVLGKQAAYPYPDALSV